MLRITPLNDEAATEGTWTTYMGVDLKIARSGNDAFNKVFQTLTRPHKFEMDRGTMSTDTMKSIMCEALARTILVDWKNLVIDGKNVKYSPSNAQELLENDADCRNYVQAFSEDVGNYLTEQEKEVKGKSSTASDGD